VALALGLYRALTNTTIQSSAFLLIPRQCNCTFTMILRHISREISRLLNGAISNPHQVFEISDNTSKLTGTCKHILKVNKTKLVIMLTNLILFTFRTLATLIFYNFRKNTLNLYFLQIVVYF